MSGINGTKSGTTITGPLRFRRYKSASNAGLFATGEFRDLDYANTAEMKITNAQLLTLFSVGFQVLAAPSQVGNYIEILRFTIINRNTGVAYAAGGALQLSYGTGVTTPASATLAATFLTSPTVPQIATVLGALGSAALNTAILNKAINLVAATQDFTTGTGDALLFVDYRVRTAA